MPSRQARDLNAVISKLPEKFIDISDGSRSMANIVDAQFKRLGDSPNLANLLLEMEKIYDFTKVGVQNPGQEPGTPPPGHMMGKVKYYDDGGFTDFVPRGSDTIPAMLAKGESVVTADATRDWAPLIEAMNSGVLSTRSNGGSHPSFGDITINVQGGDTSDKTIREIGTGLRRALRRGSRNLGVKMIQFPTPKQVQKFGLSGRFDVEQFRRDSRGVLRFLKKHTAFNDIVTAGKNMIFNTMFNGGTPSTTWYIGLINNAGFTALAAADVMNSHGGWAEFTAYSETNRVTWGSGSASGASITNGTAAEFDITGSSATLYGIFITDQNTKGGTTGNLWSTAPFASLVPVNPGDALKVTYTLNA